jgi:activator of HSP90 ATPase
MTATIEQTVRFPASARELYDMYLDPAKHAAMTAGGAVKISAKPGSKFTAFDGMLSGITIAAVPGKLIVQRWRGSHWNEADADSVLVLNFSDETRKDGAKSGRIDLAHVNVPKHDHAGVTQGWKQYYWKPMRAYFKKLHSGER